MQVLVVDDRATAAYLGPRLEQNGCDVVSSGDGKDAFEKTSPTPYDFLILHVVLPSLDGLALCRQLRQDGHTVKILMLSRVATIDDPVARLKAGADAFLDKPLAFRELLARLRALERAGRDEDEPRVLQIGDLRLDRINHAAARGKRQIKLTGREFSLLELLMCHPGEPLGRAVLVSSVWGGHVVPDSNLVDVYISRLRRKIDDPFPVKLIQTVHRVGYRIATSADKQ
jgi:DNA-binding response OmpR family regulator